MTKDVLSRRDKSKQIKQTFCRDKNMFVATKVLSQKHTFVATKDVFCRDTSLSQQDFCRQKRMLLAAPANDINELVRIQRLDGNRL